MGGGLEAFHSPYIHFPGQALSLGEEEEEEERGKISPTKKNDIWCACQRLLSFKPKCPLCGGNLLPRYVTPFCKAVKCFRGSFHCLLTSVVTCLGEPLLLLSSHRIGYRRADKHETTA